MLHKYLERRLSQPGILIFKEKHHTHYFVCNSKEDFCKVALNVLARRLQEGWYYDEELSKEELAAQEAAAYAGAMIKQRRIHKDKTEATKIVETNDAEAAYVFLDDHSDCEYGQMRIEYPESY